MRKFVIVNLERSSKDQVVFWKADDLGYTSNPFEAGIYDENVIKSQLDYYCEGDVPIVLDELRSAGIKISVDSNHIFLYQKRIRKELSEKS
jgi:hypothetical protein